MKKNYAIVDTETLGGASDAYVHTYDLSAVAYDRNGIWLDSIQIVILENLILDTAYYGKFKKNFYKSLLRMPSTTICYTEAEAEEVAGTAGAPEGDDTLPDDNISQYGGDDDPSDS